MGPDLDSKMCASDALSDGRETFRIRVGSQGLYPTTSVILLGNCPLWRVCLWEARSGHFPQPCLVGNSPEKKARFSDGTGDMWCPSHSELVVGPSAPCTPLKRQLMSKHAQDPLLVSSGRGKNGKTNRGGSQAVDQNPTHHGQYA